MLYEYLRVSTAKSLNLSNTLFDNCGNEHIGSEGTRISRVGSIGALTGGSGFAFSVSGGLPPSNIKLIAISTFPSANVRYCRAVASLSPKWKTQTEHPARRPRPSAPGYRSQHLYLRLRRDSLEFEEKNVCVYNRDANWLCSRYLT